MTPGLVNSGDPEDPGCVRPWSYRICRNRFAGAVSRPPASFSIFAVASAMRSPNEMRFHDPAG